MTLIKRPTKAIIDLSRIVGNWRALNGLLPAGQEALPIVKANGYGLGAVPVARALVADGAVRLAVATFEEALALRAGGLAVPVFVLNGLMGPEDEYRRNGLIPVLHHVCEIKRAAKSAATAGGRFDIALKFDTGMGRLGILPAEIDAALTRLRGSGLNVVCVMTHLARADEGVECTLEAYARFKDIRAAFRASGFGTAKFSICNSASIIDRHFDDFDWVRPGIALYGAYPHDRQRDLIAIEPALRLESAVIELKTLPQGAPVGYGGTFVCPRDSRIAIVPVGYADGYPRLVSNRGCVLIRGRRAPIVGRISMDLMAVDATDVPGADDLDPVTLIGSDGGGEIRVEEVAKWAETISYEILTGLMPRVHRESI
jgi:alanine racemase